MFHANNKKLEMILFLLSLLIFEKLWLREKGASNNLVSKFYRNDADLLENVLTTNLQFMSKDLWPTSEIKLFE